MPWEVLGRLGVRAVHRAVVRHSIEEDMDRFVQDSLEHARARNEKKIDRQSTRARCERCGVGNHRKSDGYWFLSRLMQHGDPKYKPHFFCPEHAPKTGSPREAEWF
jgi:hypothetical protein